MKRPWPVLFAVLSLCATAAWSEGESSPSGTGSVGIGYDEGVVARVAVLSFVNAYLGLGYSVVGPDTMYHQPLNTFSWKLGGEYILKTFGKLRVGAFGEWRQEMVQGETDRALGLNTLRYNQWNTYLRAGIRPEWFLLDQLSIDYKLGLQYVHHGPTFKVNAAGTGTESNKDDYDSFGVYEGRSPVGPGASVLLNIGLTLYLVKLPFLK